MQEVTLNHAVAFVVLNKLTLIGGRHPHILWNRCPCYELRDGGPLTKGNSNTVAPSQTCSSRMIHILHSRVKLHIPANVYKKKVMKGRQGRKKRKHQNVTRFNGLVLNRQGTGRHKLRRSSSFVVN